MSSKYRCKHHGTDYIQHEFIEFISDATRPYCAYCGRRELERVGMDKEALKKAIEELNTNSYRIGLVSGGRTEYFVNGEILTIETLVKRQDGIAARVNALIDDGEV